MITATVPVLSFVTIAIAMIAGLLIPTLVFLFFKKKYDCKALPFFVGCGVFFLSAMVLEGIAHAIILGGGRAEAIMAKPILFSIYGGFMAGLFEETGRFIAYKFLLKKSDSDNTALAYGAGHGGFEVFYILFVSMITNLVFGVMINTGNTELLFKGLDEAKSAQMLATLNTLCSTKPGMFLVSVAERISAVILQISLSVLVWFAVKKGRWFYFPLAIVLHMFIDTIAGITRAVNTPIFVVELLILGYAVICAFLARFVWKREA